MGMLDFFTMKLHSEIIFLEFVFSCYSMLRKANVQSVLVHIFIKKWSHVPMNFLATTYNVITIIGKLMSEFRIVFFQSPNASCYFAE